MCYRDMIDDQAEREGAAIDWNNENVRPQIPGRLQVARERARDAAELGLPDVQHPRYARYKAVMAWLRACDTFKAGRIPRPPTLYFDTKDDRRRQAERRLGRLALLNSLARRRKPLTIREACEATDTPLSSVEKAMRRGELARVKEGRRVFVTADSAREFVRRRAVA